METVIEQVNALLPEDLSPYIARTVSAGVVLLIGLIVYWSAAHSLATLHRTRRLSKGAHYLLRRVRSWVAWIVILLLVLQQFGLLQNMWAMVSTIFALVAIGFVATWSVLSNTFCSVILMVTRPFNVGDTIEIPADSLQGRVVDFNLVFTTLLDDQGHQVQIPNNIFFQKAIRRRVGESTVSLDQQADREEAAA